MGRTSPTYRMLLESKSREWKDFKKTLTGRDREAFEGMFLKSRMHASSSSYTAALDPFECFAISVLLEHEKEIDRLKKRQEHVSR